MGKVLLLCLLVGLSGGEVIAQVSPTKAAFIEHLLGQMTLAEKVGQLELVGIDRERTGASIREGIAGGLVGGIGGVPSPPYGRELQQVAMEHSRLKIPLFFAADVIHGLHTVFPVSLGLAASWDMSAITLAGRISAREASAEGVHLTFGPTLDITRDPRWGRVSESYGEDTYLASRIAGVMVKAYRGDDPRAADSLMAGLKHFALYGAVEGGKDYNSVDMSTVNMYPFYFAPYRAAVEAGAGMAMIAFNAIGGVPAAANRWLIKDVLRHQWGFDGVTLGDCKALEGLVFHGVARDLREAAALALRSGVDMEVCEDAYARYLPGLVASGEVEAGVLDEAVRHVLGLKYDLGLFSNPYRNLNPTALPPVETRLRRDAARDIARKTFVLLKNARQTLPLNKQDSIALIGPFAQSRRDLLGSYCGDCDEQNVVSLYEGLARALEGKAPLLYAKGANFTTDTRLSERLEHYNTPLDLDPRSAEALLDEALDVARRAKVIVAVVGEPWSVNDESISRAHINLPASQRRLLGALKSLDKPLVIVLVNGRPLDLTREQAQADALLETWFSGIEGGNAVADVLFGDYNPSGKLPMTFPRSVGQIPVYYNHLNTGRPFNSAEPRKYMSQYVDEAEGPLYPFGYGLSYTRFELSDLQLSTPVLHAGEQLKARITLVNTGPRDGETVVQLYIRDLVASVSRPVKELKGFQKIMLRAGERRVVEFTLDENDLKFYDAQLNHVAEPGEFKVQIGLDSQDVKEQSFELR